MISYHPGPVIIDNPWAYAKGFKTVDTQDVGRIAVGVTQYVCSGNIWKDGRRSKDGFLFSDWALLDFDEGDMTLEQAKENAFVDMTHIIGTTKSHQKQKKEKGPCDRFRVLLPWANRINDRRVYRWNMELLSKKYTIDLKALDAAHYFFPCKEIISTNPDGFSLDVDLDVPEDFDAPVDPAEYRRYVEDRMQKHALTKRLPKHVEDFVDYGKLMKSGRNISCYVSAITLFECGYTYEEVLKALERAPFDRSKDWNPRELTQTINSAYQRVLRQGGFVDEREV